MITFYSFYFIFLKSVFSKLTRLSWRSFEKLKRNLIITFIIILFILIVWINLNRKFFYRTPDRHWKQNTTEFIIYRNIKESHEWILKLTIPSGYCTCWSRAFMRNYCWNHPIPITRITCIVQFIETEKLTSLLYCYLLLQKGSDKEEDKKLHSV